MPEISYQSSIDDWKASSHQHVSRKESIPISTITHTDYVTSTLTASTTATAVATARTYPTSTTTNYAEDVWEHRIHRFLPVILAFAIIGILTVFVCLVYLAYRFYQANRSSRRRHQQQHQRRRRDAEEALKFEDENKTGSTTLSNIIPWLAIPSPLHASSYTNYQPKQREPIRYEKSDLNRIMMEDNSDTTSSRRPSFAWLIKILPNKTASSRPRHVSLPILTGPTIDNLNVPISSTFKPIDTSFLTLVPRSEIWLDPNRRRGVDELDIWERKKSGTVVGEESQQGTVSVVQPAAPLMWRFPSETAYPSSPESFERRFPDITSDTVQEHLHPHQIMSDSSSQSADNNAQEKKIIPTSSISYPNEAQYQIKEDDEITINQAESSDQNDVNLVRQALEASRLKNSSSQWLYTSGSKSF